MFSHNLLRVLGDIPIKANEVYDKRVIECKDHKGPVVVIKSGQA